MPAQSGVLVDGKHGIHSSSRPNSISSDSSSAKLYVPQTPAPTLPPTTTEKPILGYLSPAESGKLDKSPYLGFDHYPNEVAVESKRLYPIRGSHDDLQVESERPLIQLPSIEMAPPVEHRRRRPIRPIAVVPANPAPIAANDLGKSDAGYHYPNPAPFATSAPPQQTGYYYEPATTSTLSHNQPPQTLPSDVNALEGLLPPLPPLYQRRRVPVSQGGYGTRLVPPEYNDVTMTRNGFRYVLPHQYHEEEQLNESKKAGSFGYVDPFGIRRVVYYNASPQKGFIHRNHNQYVGLGAAPYDEPQPQSPSADV